MATLTVLHGAGRQSEPVDEPNWELLIPAPLDGSDDNSAMWRQLAAREWRRLVGAMMEAGTLASENRHQIQRLILAYLRYDLAASKVFAGRAVIGSPKTGVPMLSLWQVEMRAADADATSAEMELGITPRRRAAAGKVKPKAKQAGAADGYLTIKKGA